MIIANQKKKESIVEYIIYMWQTEDLIRAHYLDIDKLETNVIAAYHVEQATKNKIRQWYTDLIQMMQVENIQKHGHLQVVTNLVLDLNDLHRSILALPTEITYHRQYVAVAPDIEWLRKKTPDSENINEIQLCLNALYGFVLMKMSGKTISPETQHSIQQIAKFMNQLAKKYHERQKNEMTDENIHL